MISKDLIDELHSLSRADKLRVIQLLAGELAADEPAHLVPGAQYEVWSPYDASEAADVLLRMLYEDKAGNG